MTRDFHLHTQFSFDGRARMEEYVLEAIRLGMEEICITEHQELYESGTEYRPYDGEGYLAEVKRLQELYGQQLILRHGLELGLRRDTADVANMLAQKYPYDFIILSAHWCEGGKNFYSRPWDGWTNGDVFRLYLENFLDYIELVPDFDVLGHITYYSRKSPYPEKAFHYGDAPDQLDTLFRRLIQRGKGIEINTSTVDALGFSMPDGDILSRYRELGGEILTIGSDAHSLAQFHRGLSHGEAAAKQAGFTHYTTFAKRKPVFHPFG